MFFWSSLAFMMIQMMLAIWSLFPLPTMVKHLPTMQETQVQSLGWADLLEKEMATHSSILASKILWTEKPGRLQSIGSQRVGHDRATSLSLSSAFSKTSLNIRKFPWRRKWHPTPVFLPGKSHGGRSPVGYSPWGHKESNTTERLHFTSLQRESV